MKYSPHQFALWRILFGIYLLFYLSRTLPYAAELFSAKGVMPNASDNWTYGLFPNVLYYYDSVFFINIFLVIMILLAACFTLGFFRRTSSFILWYGWVCLFNRNNFTEDPVLPYTGWLILACALIPAGEPFSFPFKAKKQKWHMPKVIYYGAWLILGLSYTVTGIEKLFAPSWKNGMAMKIIYETSIAWNWPVTNFMKSMPLIFLKLQTWIAVALQVTSLPLYLFRKTRFWAWILMVGMHILTLLTLNIVQVSFGILLFHLFVADYSWLSKTPVYSKLLNTARKISVK